MKNIFVLLTLFSGLASFAGENCSQISKCAGERWELNSQGAWSLAEAGRPVAMPAGEKLCEGAFSSSPGVDFSTGVRFVVQVINSNEFVQKEMGKNLKLAQGSFLDTLTGGSLLGSADVKLKSDFLSASATVRDQHYKVVCTK